jgi:hypothetical protein
MTDTLCCECSDCKYVDTGSYPALVLTPEKVILYCQETEKKKKHLLVYTEQREDISLHLSALVPLTGCWGRKQSNWSNHLQVQLQVAGEINTPKYADISRLK